MIHSLIFFLVVLASDLDVGKCSETVVLQEVQQIR
jgi:hypothetical protein